MYLPGEYGQWANRYPTQLLLLAFDFGLFAFLWKWRLKQPAEGKTTLVFLLSFSIFRLLLDGIRNLPMVNDWLNIHQLGSIAILLVTLYYMFEMRMSKSSKQV